MRPIRIRILIHNWPVLVTPSLSLRRGGRRVQRDRYTANMGRERREERRYSGGARCEGFVERGEGYRRRWAYQELQRGGSIFDIGSVFVWETRSPPTQVYRKIVLLHKAA